MPPKRPFLALTMTYNIMKLRNASNTPNRVMVFYSNTGHSRVYPPLLFIDKEHSTKPVLKNKPK